MDPFEHIPDEIILEQALLLGDYDIADLCNTSKRFNAAICRDSQFWKRKTQKEFGPTNWREAYFQLKRYKKREAEEEWAFDVIRKGYKVDGSELSTITRPIIGLALQWATESYAKEAAPVYMVAAYLKSGKRPYPIPEYVSALWRGFNIEDNDIDAFTSAFDELIQTRASDAELLEALNAIFDKVEWDPESAIEDLESAIRGVRHNLGEDKIPRERLDMLSEFIQSRRG